MLRLLINAAQGQALAAPLEAFLNRSVYVPAPGANVQPCTSMLAERAQSLLACGSSRDRVGAVTSAVAEVDLVPPG